MDQAQAQGTAKYGTYMQARLREVCSVYALEKGGGEAGADASLSVWVHSRFYNINDCTSKHCA